MFADKAMSFSVEIVNLHKQITKTYHEYIMSDQMKRSGTAIGALYGESRFAESDADFIHKLRIALKEANETVYWLDLLYNTDYIAVEKYNLLKQQLTELIKMLIASINTTNKRINNSKQPPVF